MSLYLRAALLALLGGSLRAYGYCGTCACTLEISDGRRNNTLIQGETLPVIRFGSILPMSYVVVVFLFGQFHSGQPRRFADSPFSCLCSLVLILGKCYGCTCTNVESTQSISPFDDLQMRPSRSDYISSSILLHTRSFPFVLTRMAERRRSYCDMQSLRSHCSTA